MVPYTLVFSDIAYNFILAFYENKFISAMFFASCVDAIIETFYDIYFNTFALNAFVPTVFRTLGKQLPHFFFDPQVSNGNMLVIFVYKIRAFTIA